MNKGAIVGGRAQLVLWKPAPRLLVRARERLGCGWVGGWMGGAGGRGAQLVLWKPAPCKAAGQDAALVLAECRYTVIPDDFIGFFRI